MRDGKGRFTSKGIIIQIPTFATVLNYLFMIIILIPWIYFGTKLNLLTKLRTLLDALFDDAYCENSKRKNGEY